MKKIVRTNEEEKHATRPNIYRNKKKYWRSDLKRQMDIDEGVAWYKDKDCDTT